MVQILPDVFLVIPYIFKPLSEIVLLIRVGFEI